MEVGRGRPKRRAFGSASGELEKNGRRWERGLSWGRKLMLQAERGVLELGGILLVRESLKGKRLDPGDRKYCREGGFRVRKSVL